MSFQFTRDHVVYHVHSEVGDGAARIVVEEQERPDPDLESCDEEFVP